MAGNVHQDDPEKLWNSAIVECKKIEIDGCNAVTGWAVAGQAANLTASTTHMEGTHSLEFDKSGEEGTDGYIEKTITSVNIGDFQTHAIGHTKVYLSDVSQVSKVFIRLGTDSSNYFQYDFTILEDGWNDLDFMLSHRTSQLGIGADLSDVTYVAAGVVMNANGNTLTDIRVDSIHVKRMLEALAFGAPSIEFASRIRLQDNNTGRMLEINSAHEALTHDGDVGTELTAIKDTDGIKKITDKVTVIQDAKDRTISGTVDVDGSGVTQPISATALPLPSGAATSAKQLPDGHNVTVSGTANPTPFSTMLSSAITLTTANTAYKLPASEQSGRVALVIYNNSDTTVLIGGSGVSVANGMPLASTKYIVIPASANVYAVCGSAGKTLRLLECK